jgi:DNA topoisomerase VI subunit B
LSAFGGLNIACFGYNFEQNFGGETTYMAGFKGKFVDVGQKVKEKTEKSLLNVSKKGCKPTVHVQTSKS